MAEITAEAEKPASSVAVSEFRQKGHGFALLVSFGSALFMALLFAAIRAPFGDTSFGISYFDVARAVGFASLLMFSLSYSILSCWRAWAAVSLPVVVGTFLLALGMMLPIAADAALIALLMFFARPLRQLRIGSFGDYVLGLLAALLLALVQIFTLVRTNYSPPLAFEQALAGILTQDTLFHATLAGISDKYGIVSFGIDGLNSFNYHVFSHKIFSAFAVWSDIPVLMSYSLFFAVVALPLMTFFLLINIVSFKGLSDASANPIVAILLSTAMMIGITTLALRSFWISESAVVGNWFLLLGIVLLGLVARQGEDWKNPRIAVVMAIFILCASFAKISAGAVLAGGVFFWYVFSAQLTWRGIFYATYVAVLPLIFVFAFTFLDRVQNNSYGHGTFGLFRMLQSFPIFWLLIGLLAVGLTFIQKRANSADKAELPLRLSVIIMLMLSIAAASVLRLPGIGEIYFFGPGVWAVMAFFVRDGRFGLFLQKKTTKLRNAVLIGLIVLPILGTNTVGKGISNLRKNITTLEGFSSPATPTPTPVSTTGLLANTVLGQIFLAVQADPTIEAVNVAPNLTAFWDGRKPCWKPSLSVQALTSLPMIAGAPPQDRDCKTSPFYGFADYDPVLSMARVFTDAELCSRAQELGFARVLKVEETLRSIDCAK